MTHEEESELLALLQEQQMLLEEIRANSAEHVQIAREYKESVGDPLRRIIYAVNLVGKIMAYIIGSILTLLGLHEAWDAFFKAKFK